MRNIIVRKHYNHIFYEDIEIGIGIGDVKIINKEDFKNLKKALNEIRNKKTNKVLVFDSLGQTT
jgi:hypothetical protein